MRSDAKRIGATFVTYESPTGERQSSPHVWKVKAATSQSGLTSTPLSARFPPITMNTKPNPSSMRPIAILRAVDGSRPIFASFIQIHANSGAKMMITAGFTFCDHADGM